MRIGSNLDLMEKFQKGELITNHLFTIESNKLKL